MKRFLILAFMIAQVQIAAVAQGEGNIWMFNSSGLGQYRGWIDFNTAVPAITYPLSIPYTHANNELAVPVCRPNGQLLFTVECSLNNYPAASDKIRDANGNWIPGSNFTISAPQSLGGMYFPIVVPHPANPDQYYIFYTYENALMYSLLDMSAGGGAILPGQKDIALTSVGSVFPNALAAVKGCSGVWVVTRARAANEYYSFHVGYNGLDTQRVISATGLMPVNDILSYSIGKLVAAPTGDKLAFVSSWKGIELYDFEACSGQLSNARIIDDLTPENTFPRPWMANDLVHCPSGCFSPDGSKFYASQNRMVDTFISLPFGGTITSFLQSGQLFQYDLSQPNLPLIIASKTLVLANQQAIIADLAGCFPYNMALGDVKLGPNQKVYVDNGSATCYQLGTIPGGTNPAGFHAINQPNLAGLACLPEYNAIVVPNITPSVSDPQNPGFIRGIYGTAFLPPDIIIAPPLPDTVAGDSYQIPVCFRSEWELKAGSGAGCPVWDDGSEGDVRIVKTSGTYWVRYFRDCAVRTDTFHVQFTLLPAITDSVSACPGEGLVFIKPEEGDTSVLNYVLRDGTETVVAAASGPSGARFTGLAAGSYTVNVITSACDSTFPITVHDLPKPVLEVNPADTTIKYGEQVLLHATGASLYVWWPSGPLDTATKASPLARPLLPTLFTVVGLNEHGCRDTGFVKVNLDYSMTQLVPNAFSPNGDGLNDVFSLRGIVHQKVSRFSVYNRGGQEVYHGFGANAGWDGSYHEKPCDAGTYFYWIEIAYPDGRLENLRGDLTLIR